MALLSKVVGIPKIGIQRAPGESINDTYKFEEEIYSGGVLECEIGGIPDMAILSGMAKVGCETG